MKTWRVICSIVAIIGSVLGISWYQTDTLGRRINDQSRRINDQSQRITEVKQEIAELRSYFVQHLDGHPPRVR